MKITTFSSVPHPLSREYKVKESHVLTPSGLVPLDPSPATSLYASPLTRLALLSPPVVSAAQPSEKENQPHEAGPSVRMQDVAKAMGTGGGIIPPALKMYQLGNTTSKAELVQFFTTNNFTPNAADNLADKVLEIAQSQLAKSLFLGLAGGALVFSVLEVVEPHWSQKRKLILALGAALFLVILYLILAHLGIMT